MKLDYNDFKQVLDALENIVFKVGKDDTGNSRILISEGKIARAFEITTNRLQGTAVSDIFKGEMADSIAKNLELAFSGQNVDFELIFGNCAYYITLAPVTSAEGKVEVVGCGADITKYKIAEEKLYYMANYDSLTDLPNKTMLRERFKFVRSHVHRSETMTALIMLDLDRFKIINDTLGHDIGDMILIAAAKRLKKIIREDDTLCRFGGDEFVILLSELKNEDYVGKLVQNILDDFRYPFMIDGREFFITPSIGITIYPHDGEEFEDLIKNAEIAMFRAKDDGRNKYHFYTSIMNGRALERLGLENFLRKAVEYDELMLLYQPQIDIKTGKVIGAEALVRWKHPQLGMVSPSDFIPLAEETGLILSIGLWVLKTACEQNKYWHEKGYGDLKIAVNVSARQFADKNLAEKIQAILQDIKLNPEVLELEITENTLMEDTELTLMCMNKLKDMGIKIAIDDFGTGFSSLSYLTTFKADILKIDRSFIKVLQADINSRTIATAIINLAHNLKLQVVAEGVEELEQLEFLRQEYCDFIQGYYFSKPVTACEFERILIEDKKL